MRPRQVEWRVGASPSRQRAAWLVVAVHGLLLVAWVQHTGRIIVNTPQAPPSRTTLSWVRTVPTSTTAAVADASRPQAKTPAPQQRLASEQRSKTPPADRSVRQAEAPAPQHTTLSVLPAASAPEPGTPSSTSMGALLRSEATRQALRHTSQQPLLAERAEAATGVALRRQDAALAEKVQQSAHADCLKGDPNGKGMGLLALPFLAYAAATDQCAR